MKSWPQLTNMCELAFIEYNPTFDLIMQFPCFFDVRSFINDTNDWPRFRVRNSHGTFSDLKIKLTVGIQKIIKIKSC
jgi:hypothetical protein